MCLWEGYPVLEGMSYYPVWISPSRQLRGWSFGPACDSPVEANRVLKDRLKEGATLGCVVEMRKGPKGVEKTPLITYVQPASARKILEHWEDLWDSTEGPAPAPG